MSRQDRSSRSRKGAQLVALSGALVVHVVLFGMGQWSGRPLREQASGQSSVALRLMPLPVETSVETFEAREGPKRLPPRTTRTTPQRAQPKGGLTEGSESSAAGDSGLSSQGSASGAQKLSAGRLDESKEHSVISGRGVPEALLPSGMPAIGESIGDETVSDSPLGGYVPPVRVAEENLRDLGQAAPHLRAAGEALASELIFAEDGAPLPAAKVVRVELRREQPCRLVIAKWEAEDPYLSAHVFEALWDNPRALLSLCSTQLGTVALEFSYTSPLVPIPGWGRKSEITLLESLVQIQVDARPEASKAWKALAVQESGGEVTPGLNLLGLGALAYDALSEKDKPGTSASERRLQNSRAFSEPEALVGTVLLDEMPQSGPG